MHPLAAEVARRHGLDLSHAVPLSLAQVESEPDLVVTVCDKAHEELSMPGAARLHWAVPDPAEKGTLEAFEAAYSTIRERVGALVPSVRSGSGGSRSCAGL